MSSLNFLSPLGFQFSLAKLPELSFSVQMATLPGIELGTALRPTPFVPQHVPGNISFSDFSVSFKISESMDEYLALAKWMYQLGIPKSTDQHEFSKSDASILILNSSKRPAIEAKFTDCYPTSLTPIAMDVTSTDIQYVTCTASFAFLTYDYLKI